MAESDPELVDAFSPEQNPWTVARCNRLLRSISSRIATIRSLVKNFDRAPIKPRAQVSGTSNLHLSPAAAKNGTFFLPYLQSPHGQDPEWMPQAGNPSSRTYGGRNRSHKPLKEPADNPLGASKTTALRTPFLRKLLRPGSDASPLAPPTFKDRARINRGIKKSRQLPIKPSTSLGEAQRNLVAAFGTFLINSRPMKTPARKGARKLHEICLGQVPQHIELLEELQREDGQDGGDLDVMDDTYTFLEGLGSFGNDNARGYAGLRRVVRSHGLHMIVTAIGEGILRDRIVEELIEVCRQYKAVAEGQLLLEVWAKKEREPKEVLPSDAIRTLVNSSIGMDSNEFLYRQMAQLLDNGRVLHSQLTGLGELWRPVLYKLAAPDCRLEAAQLLEAYAASVARHGYAEENRVLNRHSLLWSLGVVLTAMVWMQGQENDINLDNSSLAWQLQRMLRSVFATSASTTHLTSTRPLILGGLISRSTEDTGNTMIARVPEGHLIEALAQIERPQASSEDPECVCEVAKVVSHVDVEMSFEMMKSTALGLAKASSKQSDAASVNYLRHLAVDSAMKFAESRDDIESYEWAESVADLFAATDATLETMQTPVSHKPTKYRWEAGMCEWIKATPFEGGKRVKRRISEEIDDSGFGILDDALAAWSRGPAGNYPSRKRRISFSPSDDDSDLEERDELSMHTPELIRLRDLRAKKARRELSSEGDGKENVSPTKHSRSGAEKSRGSLALDDMSEDELGL